MSSILPKPIFDDNTCFYKISPSHKALEAQWIVDTVNPNKILSIVSSGHDGIELAKLDDDTRIYLPTVTPRKIVEKSKEVSKNVIRVGKNYPECYRMLEGIIRNNENMINVSSGMVEKHLAHKRALEKLTRKFNPDYIFVPDSNMDLSVGILEGLKENEMSDITVVASILPDHFTLSPRFNTKYKHKLFFTGITFAGHDAPGLNRDYKLHGNFVSKTVASPDFCFSKYSQYYPNLDAMNFLNMEISTKFNVDSKKLVVITGDTLL
ncbi:hypothetical protein KAU33_04050 [Candidatus Dependentiae bacterium]|nr:hypothetical protein [Candidatus Dependentiae bacterium]